MAVIDATVNDDVGMTTGGSGVEMRGWGLGWSVIDRFGIMCHHFPGVWGWFDAVERFAVAIVSNIDSIDGSCAGDDMAALEGVPGCSRRVCMAMSVV